MVETSLSRFPEALGDATAELYCRACGNGVPVGPCYQGCPNCGTPGDRSPLEMRYSSPAIQEAFATPDSSSRGLWAFAAGLPPAAQPVTLGEGRTPLLAAPALATKGGLSHAWLKYEGAGPTGSWKDRLNAVTVTMAKQTGAPGIVCSTTGNHGVSLAAYAAAAGLPAVVLMPHQAPQEAKSQAQLHGALTVVTDWETRARVVDALLGSHGWALSNRNDPRPWGNPFGIEGYRAISFEIVREYGGVPDAIVVPTCGADGLYGIWKGFRELFAAGLIDRTPRMVAVQPEVSSSLVDALEAEATLVSEIPLQHSVALSLSDQRSGRLGLIAIRESGGLGIRVSEAEIKDGVLEIGRLGLCVEPAAAAGVAAMQRLPTDIRSAVFIVTASGIRWPATFADVAPPIARPSVEEILAEIIA